MFVGPACHHLKCSFLSAVLQYLGTYERDLGVCFRRARRLLDYDDYEVRFYPPLLEVLRLGQSYEQLLHYLLDRFHQAAAPERLGQVVNQLSGLVL